MALIDRGQGFIYDTDLNITWLQDANYARTSGRSPDGSFATWSEATQWAGSLRIAGYAGWRLPTAQPGCEGKGCAGGEIGHLWLIEGPQLPGGRSPFINVQSGAFAAYWTGTEIDATYASVWKTESLEQKRALKIPDIAQSTARLFAWPVRNGDSPPKSMFSTFSDRVASLRTRRPTQ